MKSYLEVSGRLGVMNLPLSINRFDPSTAPHEKNTVVNGWINIIWFIGKSCLPNYLFYD